jgi:hypothetical protein
MKPSKRPGGGIRLSRRELLMCGVVALGGCASRAINLQSPEDEFDLLESNVRLVGDFAVPYGLATAKVSGVALVTQLAGTGSDPPPSVLRSSLINEMQIRKVEHPNQVLASPNTALVLATGYLRPGIQKGERFDLFIQSPPQSETTSLRGGWLMETRLTDLTQEVQSRRLFAGRLRAVGQGPIVVDPLADAKTARDRQRLQQGRVLGGGVAIQSRDVGLLLPEKSARTSDSVAKAINTRFHHYVNGIQEGVATARTDEFISLKVHPHYKHNLARYMAVVRSVSIREPGVDRAVRLRYLQRQLLDPVTAATAAVRLEAIGAEGVDVLLVGVASSNPEVRFYAAEALAYLDRPEAAAPLAEAALAEPAFRAYALAALSAMDDVAAYEQLRKLLDASSAETRYGAFRALWMSDPKVDPQVRGEAMGRHFSYHSIPSDAPPMIHVTTSFRPEVVLFGDDQRLDTPVVLDAGPRVMINAQGPDHVVVSRFAEDGSVTERVVSSRIDDMIRAAADVGATYADVMQALVQAKTKRCLPGRLEVDALPRTGRLYHRKGEGGAETLPGGAASKPDGVPAAGEARISSPTPELFRDEPEPAIDRRGQPPADKIEFGPPADDPSSPGSHDVSPGG